MRKLVTLCVVFTWLSCALAYQQRRSCSDCVGYKTCPAAVELLSKQQPAADAQLKSGFCGFDSSRLPMVCCAYLTNTSSSGEESVENHPNLRLLPDSCGKGEFNDTDRIIGGRPAGLYEFPWMVLISYNTSKGLRFSCGGSLISDRYVLTAAHCIANRKLAALAGVRIGENDVDTTTDCEPLDPLECESNIQDLRIEEAIPHPHYQGKPNIRNDIALLRLRNRVDLSFKNAGVICLPVTEQLQSRNLSGIYATVAGWGYTENFDVSSKLRFVKVPIHTAESCRELYNRGAQPGTDDTINKLCAGKIGKDSCGGDSGGPLMVKTYYSNSAVVPYIQHGIVSYGPRLCGSNFPSVYTDVSKYMKWILDNIKP